MIYDETLTIVGVFLLLLKLYTIIFVLLEMISYLCTSQLNTSIMGKFNFKNDVLREQVTSRGGGVEIDLTRFGFDGHKMSAYQNYLGGGMLGSIAVNDTVRASQTEHTQEEGRKLDKLGKQLIEYYYILQYGKLDKKEFTLRQGLPSSAY